MIGLGTELDPSLTKSDSLVGSVVGHPDALPTTYNEIDLDVELFDVAIGSPSLLKVEKIKKNESLRLNVGTAVTAGTVSHIKNNIITINLRRPITAEEKSRLAISRRIGERWRLIGVGVIS